MCGDCTEGMVLDFVGPGADTFFDELNEKLPHKDATFTERPSEITGLGMNLRHAWQEADDFFSRISNEKDFLVRGFQNYAQHHEEQAQEKNAKKGTASSASMVFGEFVEIAVCRLFQQYILHGFEPTHLLKIEKRVGQGALSDYFESQRKAETGTIWDSLCYRETFVLRERWNDFIRSVTGDLRCAEAQVAAFIEKCTTGFGGGFPDEVSTPATTIPLPENLASAPSSVGKCDGKFFSEQFSATLFAMLILARYSPRHELLRKLALARPGFCDFCGNSYWIARWAFFHCVQEQGIDFIFENERDVRYLLIAYVVLKASLPKSDLHRLRLLIQELEPLMTWQVDDKQLIQIIDQRLGYPAWFHDQIDRIVGSWDKPGGKGAHPPRILTGVPAIDAIFPGFKPGEVTFVGTRYTNDGTDFGLNLLLATAGGNQAEPVVLWAMKSPSRQIAARMLGIKTGLSQARLEDDRKILQEAGKALERLPIVIRESKYPKLGDIRASANDAKRSNNASILLIEGFDLIALTVVERDDTDKEPKGVFQNLKELAEDLGIAVICISQMAEGLALRTVQYPDYAVWDCQRWLGVAERKTLADNLIFLDHETEFNPQLPGAECRVEITVYRQTAGSISTCRLGYSRETGIFREV
ncbi:MAG: hypothetical protein HQM09_24945 [Candidatus Riflebacteria bacterium]|nr:hypothetical protein [Candidatus Riflebacteria bacterium]